MVDHNLKSADVSDKLAKLLLYVNRILGYKQVMAVPSALFLDRGLLANIYELICFQQSSSNSKQDIILGRAL